MNLTSKSRVVVALVALVSMLFMQLALAGYACPELKLAADFAAMVKTSTAATEMPGCAQMDGVQPSLCHASAHTQHQSLEKHEVPLVQAFIPALISLILIPTPVASSLTPFQFSSIRQSGAPPPPLSIRNCCFRI